MNEKYVFKLYLTNSSTSIAGQKKISNVEIALKNAKINYSLEVVNVLESPIQAIEDGVVATPTLIQLSPPPKKKIIGKLDNTRELLAELEIEE